MRPLVLLLVVAALVLASVVHTSEGADPATDNATLSPVYPLATFPQTWNDVRAGKWSLTPVKWRRFEKNPVIPAGMNPRPVRWDEQTIRVYYGVRGPGKGIFSFDVHPDRPEKILNGPVGPVISTGEKGTCDDDWVLAPEPVRLGPQHLRMYYSAKQSQRAFFQQAWSLCAAESTDDGRTWTKHAGNPILTVGDQKWESGAVGFCSVERNASGDHWKMWYLGTDEAAIKQVGYATSKDGLIWNRFGGNPVIAVNPQLRWEAGAIAVPRVIKENGCYKVWYCCYEENNTYAIGCAESFDGIEWHRSPHNPVMTGDGEGWDSRMAAYPGVIRVGERYAMWYSGNSYGSQGMGLATAQAPDGPLLARFSLKDGVWTEWRRVEETPVPPVDAQRVQFAVLD